MGGAWILYNGQAHDLLAEEVKIGRSPSCDIVLADGLASLSHATVSIRPDAMTICDNMSHNGTLVNGTRLGGQHSLKDKDRIMIGTSQLEFRTERPEGTPVVSIFPKPRLKRSQRRRSAEDDSSTATATSTGITIFGALVARSIDNEDLTTASRIVKSMTLKLAQGAHSRTLDRGELASCSIVLRYAKATGDIRWVEWVLDLHATARAIPSPHMVDTIYSMSEELGLADPGSARRWLEAVSGIQTTDTEKKLIAKIEQLEQFASLGTTKA